MTLTGTGGNATVDTSGYTVTLSGVLSGTVSAGGLTKKGLGTLILNGANSYVGTTDVQVGGLTLGGSATFTNTYAAGTALVDYGERHYADQYRRRGQYPTADLILGKTNLNIGSAAPPPALRAAS